MKALFPRPAGAALDAVFLNTAGGLTGGDRMRITAEAQAGAQITLSSQAAERAYRAQPNQIARMDVALEVADGGQINWIPQETILFDQAALDRKLRVDLSGTGTALIVEPLVFGREAMGEDVHKLHFTDQWRVYRDKQLVFADAVRLLGDARRMMARGAIAGGARAMATVLLAGPSAGAHAGLPLPDNAGASLIADDLLLLRFLADDGFALRRDLIPVVEALSTVPLPRVWRL